MKIVSQSLFLTIKLSDWYFDRNLFLYRIEVPSSNERIPAKVITQADFISDELVIFGPQDYIETDSPEPMSTEQSYASCEYRYRKAVNEQGLESQNIEDEDEQLGM
ncbi:MAG: hypothetical protein VB064_14970 [Oscillospiraceae bacterium]|nr:hypothetical protein [Oscillospiraceae bacterium]